MKEPVLLVINQDGDEVEISVEVSHVEALLKHLHRKKVGFSRRESGVEEAGCDPLGNWWKFSGARIIIQGTQNVQKLLRGWI